jgi:hypothetical protein
MVFLRQQILLLAIATSLSEVTSFVNQPTCRNLKDSSCKKTTSTTRRQTLDVLSRGRNPALLRDSSVLSMTEKDSAQRFLDQAAKLREEIAALEGKTLEQVQDEARARKDEYSKRKEELQQRKQQESTNSSRQEKDDWGKRFIQLPTTPDDMVRQAARAVERAFKDGKTRQTVRFSLITQDQVVGDINEWPGGAQQMYREAAKPLTNALLKEIRAPTISKDNDDQDSNKREQQLLPPVVSSQDIWDFDGSALHTAEASEGPTGDVQALVFPNTDMKYIKDIEEISKAMGPRLFLLVNPFWRNIESWGFNLLAPGAKQKAQAAIFDQGYEETYVLLNFSARGENCAAIKAYPYDWQLFAYREDDNYPGMDSVIRLGSTNEEPTSELVTRLINERPEFKETKTMRQMKNLF